MWEGGTCRSHDMWEVGHVGHMTCGRVGHVGHMTCGRVGHMGHMTCGRVGHMGHMTWAFVYCHRFIYVQNIHAHAHAHTHTQTSHTYSHITTCTPHMYTYLTHTTPHIHTQHTCTHLTDVPCERDRWFSFPKYLHTAQYRYAPPLLLTCGLVSHSPSTKGAITHATSSSTFMLSPSFGGGHS